MLKKLLKLPYYIFIIIMEKVNFLYYSNKFGNFGNGSRIAKKIWLVNPSKIFIGKSCFIGPYARIETYTNYGNKITNPKLSFGDNCILQHAVHIYCANNIEFGEGCLIASGCMITDNNHGTDPESCFYADQPLRAKSTIIKEGVWLGENVCVLAGSIIGKKCIIGANSVVNSNIPDYSIAAGNPAKVIKQYNFETKEWEKV